MISKKTDYLNEDLEEALASLVFAYLEKKRPKASTLVKIKPKFCHQKCSQLYLKLPMTFHCSPHSSPKNQKQLVRERVEHLKSFLNVIN